VMLASTPEVFLPMIQILLLPDPPGKSFML